MPWSWPKRLEAPTSRLSSWSASPHGSRRAAPLLTVAASGDTYEYWPSRASGTKTSVVEQPVGSTRDRALLTEPLVWSGGARSFLDDVDVVDFGPFTVGRFGGSTITGAAQNDDGAFAVADSEGGWECAAVLDAHGSDDSASVVVAAFAGAVDEISSTLGKRVGEALREFRGLVLRLLTADPTATALASCK